MHKLASTQFCFVLAALAALTSVACGGGDDDNGADGGAGAGAGGTGGGGAGAVGSGLLVSDFETGMNDGYLVVEDKGWTIAWFTYGDPTPTGASITPPLKMPFASLTDSVRPAGQQHVANAKGMGFTTWGAGMGLNFDVSDTVTMKPKPTNLSAYKGVSFWAKTNNVTTGVIQVKMVDVMHALEADGGTCIKPAAGTNVECNNTHTNMLSAGMEWKKYELLWSQFTEGTWGQVFPQDLTKMIGFQFQVSQNTVFDYSIDDFTLLPK